MVNIVIAFIILWIGMYISIKIVNLIFFGSHQSSQSPNRRSPNRQEQSWLARLVESTLEYLQWASLSPYHENIAHAASASEIEVSAVCSEAAINVEGIEEGLQAVVESAGEHIVTAIEGLSNA